MNEWKVVLLLPWEQQWTSWSTKTTLIPPHRRRHLLHERDPGGRRPILCDRIWGRDERLVWRLCLSVSWAVCEAAAINQTKESVASSKPWPGVNRNTNTITKGNLSDTPPEIREKIVIKSVEWLWLVVCVGVGIVVGDASRGRPSSQPRDGVNIYTN